MMSYEKFIVDREWDFKYRVIEPLDVIAQEVHVKNMHLLFFILSYIEQKLHIYYELKFSPLKDKINIRRIKKFEKELIKYKLSYFIDIKNIIDLKLIIDSIEDLDLTTLHEDGYI